MKTFRDLYIQLNTVDIERFKDMLSQQCQHPWQRSTDKEGDLGLSGSKPLCFERNGADAEPSAALFLFPEDADIWYVSNIVPTDTGELSYDQYNDILESFFSDIVLPAIANTEVSAKMTDNVMSIESVAGKKVEEAFVRFSNLANKSTGSSHPSDRERWFEFLVLANEANTELHADLVIRALEELGWSEDGAYKLGSQFEFADGILSYLQER